GTITSVWTDQDSREMQREAHMQWIEDMKDERERRKIMHFTMLEVDVAVLFTFELYIEALLQIRLSNNILLFIVRKLLTYGLYLYLPKTNILTL
ncbi:hypothetical protein ACJX0J_006355, partial [Zea mays]